MHHIKSDHLATRAEHRDRVHVFVGPTLPTSEVLEIVPDALLYPPIQHGSLFALDIMPGDVVVLIDGVFHQSPAIRHKELLDTIALGAQVIGASSMGALRAAELKSYGMWGVGLVYRLYAVGALERDDEVAVVHGDASDAWRAYSVSLVSMRVNVRHARVARVITRTDEVSLINAASALPFPERNYRWVVDQAIESGLPEEAAESFLKHIGERPFDIKRADAIDALHVATSRRPPATSAMPEHIVQTSFVSTWRRQFHQSWPAGQDTSSERVPDFPILNVCQLLAHDYVQWSHEILLRNLLEVANCAVNHNCSISELEGRVLDCATSKGLIGKLDKVPSRMLQAWLSSDDRMLPLEKAVAKAMVRSYRWSPGIRVTEPLYAALAETGIVSAVRDFILETRLFNESLFSINPRYTPSRIPVKSVVKWFTDWWKTTDLDVTLMDRGFIGQADLVLAARAFCPYLILKGAPDFWLSTKTFQSEF